MPPHPLKPSQPLALLSLGQSAALRPVGLVPRHQLQDPEQRVLCKRHTPRLDTKTDHLQFKVNDLFFFSKIEVDLDRDNTGIFVLSL